MNNMITIEIFIYKFQLIKQCKYSYKLANSRIIKNRNQKNIKENSESNSHKKNFILITKFVKSK